MAGLQVGFDFKLYYNSGTDASPTWVEINIVGDVNVSPLGFNFASVPLRVSRWSLRLPTRQQEAAFEFTLANDIGGTVFDALRALAITGSAPTHTQLAAADAAIASSNTEGMKAFTVFETFPFNQPLDDLSTGDVSAPFTYTEESGSLVEPSWFSIP